MAPTWTDLAGYLRSNVLPASRVNGPPTSGRFVVAAGRAIYSPASVDPLQASGGFNSVVELAASTCRQQAARAIRPAAIDIGVTDETLAEVLGAAAGTGRLAQVPSSMALLSPQDYRGFRLELDLTRVSFADERTVTLTFLVSVSFVCQAPTLPDVPTLTEAAHRDPSWQMALSTVLSEQLEALGADAPHTSPDLRRSIAHRMRARIAGQPHRESPPGSSPSDVIRGTTAPPGPSGELRRLLIGSFTADLRAPLIHRDDAGRSRTRVFADLRHAAWTESLPSRPAPGQPPNDILLVHDALFSNWVSGATWILNAPLDLPLTPTLSLVGPNAGGAPTPELTDFEVRVAAVFDESGFEPALAVAFDVMPGCHGLIEDLRHFIGPNPYGVISDEFVVDGVFRHRWNRGGFDRRLNLRAPVQVKVNRGGQERIEDAVVFGHQQLLTLDFAAITTDSNTRGDCIALGGRAQVVATSVTLAADGQTLGSGQVDLGPAEPTRWGVNAAVALSGSFAADPEIRDFQISAQRDGAYAIASPFALADPARPPAVAYVRIEGVSRYVFFLGSVPAVLD